MAMLISPARRVVVVRRFCGFFSLFAYGRALPVWFDSVLSLYKKCHGYLFPAPLPPLLMSDFLLI